MVYFPVFDSLDISNYGLYPGMQDADPGLHVKFNPGLTLVLGTNGLGKTTLVTIMFRLLTGPYDIPGLADSADLGNRSLEPKSLSAPARAIFARRVVDGARNARARLSFRLGSHTVTVERRLNNLSLTYFAIDNELLTLQEQETFQAKIPELVGVWAFGDWILLLRHLVFYFEDRRALVWDPTAQRQLLRALFLSPSQARKWTEDEREILSIDSRMRNANATLFDHERALKPMEAKITGSEAVRDELRTLSSLQENDTKELERFDSEFIEIQNAREQARLSVLTVEQDREAQYRSIEQAKFISIAARFPNQSETARYIYTQIIANHDCLVCGSQVPNVANEFISRIEHKQCIVCGSDLTKIDMLLEANLDKTDDNVIDTINRLNLIETNLSEARHSLEEADANYILYNKKINKLSSDISKRSQRIDILVQQLPPDEADIHGKRSELLLMRARVADLKEQLVDKRKLFRIFLEECTREIVMCSEAVKRSFDNYAEGFLLEQCQLIWAPQKTRVGQTGEAVISPAFGLDMSGANLPSPVRRSGPDEVSESQREFIDLAFRMALMAVSAGENSGGSLVMDAPESSLDAVFAKRAAKVLSRFATPSLNNRLIITSNLVEGELIPGLIREATTPIDRNTRVVDLLKIAAPTAAVKALANEYADVRDRLLYNRGEIEGVQTS